MTFKVRRSFGEFTPGQFITDPAWPAENLKALISQQFIVAADPPKPEAAEAVETATRSAGRRNK